MRRITVIATITATVWFLAAPVFAKGPAEATISGPGIEEPVQLFTHHDFNTTTTRDAIGELLEMSGIWYSSHLAEPISRPASLGDPITLTWGGHYDISQHLYLDAEGGPVIHTPTQDGLEGWGGEPTGWHRVAGDLEGVLAKLGFSYDASGQGSAWSVPFGVIAMAGLTVIAIQIFRQRHARKLATISVALVALMVVPLTAWAGGWGIVSVDSVPASLHPDTTYTLEYTYLAHGQTPTDAGDTSAVFRNTDGEVLRFDAENLGDGRYTVDVEIPAGTWTWGINHSPGGELQGMGTIKSVEATQGTTGTSIETLELVLPIAAVITALLTAVEFVRIRKEGGRQATA